MTDKKHSNDKVTQTNVEDRRKAVKNILAGSGVVAGAATSSQWAKPVVDSVLLPAHAQTSDMIVLAGNAGVTPRLASQDKIESKAESVLDFFIGTANAQAEPSLAGACLTMTVTGSAFSLAVEFASAPTVQLSGTISGTSITGSGSGISVTGTVNLGSTPVMASGTISNSQAAFDYTLDSNQTDCTPIAEQTTTTTSAPTTMAPTTTMAAPTTMMPTTTMMPPTTPPQPMTTIPPQTTIPMMTTIPPMTTIPSPPSSPPTTMAPNG